jgi:diguanylate cyclase (GGDEF)-like protein
MPPERNFEKTFLEKQGIKSLLVLPVYAEAELVGFLGFDNVVTADPWHEEDITLLHIMSEIIGSAIARKRSEAIITHMAYHDALTSLPNRNLLKDRLQVAMTRVKRNKSMAAVMILDLDNFKAINDVLGHHIGDLLLKAVAERLKRCIRAGDTIARTGGDEFTVVLCDLAHAQDAAIIAQKFLDALYQPFQLEGHEVNVTTSIGISLYPLDADGMETLVKNADIAMYLSKKQGKNTFRFYQSDIHTQRNITQQNNI